MGKTIFKTIIILLSMLLFSCDSENANDCFQTSGKIISKEFPVENFNKIFLQLNAKFNLNDNFNATEASIKVVSTEINKHLRDYLEEGIQYNKKLDDIGQEDREIEESLFFYPLIGTINNLSSHLSKLS